MLVAMWAFIYPKSGSFIAKFTGLRFATKCAAKLQLKIIKILDKPL